MAADAASSSAQSLWSLPNADACPQCELTFPKPCREHLRVPTSPDDRPYTCRQCGRTYRTWYDLKKHMRYHTGERPYKCCVCPSAFYQASHLKDHERTHTGERPFRCGVCGAAFTQASILRSHALSHQRSDGFG